MTADENSWNLSPLVSPLPENTTFTVPPSCSPPETPNCELDSTPLVLLMLMFAVPAKNALPTFDMVPNGLPGAMMALVNTTSVPTTMPTPLNV